MGTLGTMAVDVRRIASAASYPLRQAVLRPHQRVDEVAFPEDDDPATATFGAVERSSGDVVGVATVLREAAPFSAHEVGLLPDAACEATTWRLRGMATREGLRGQGIGALVLAAALDHVAEEGGDLVWCNARVAAIGFYERAGLHAWGDQWVVPLTGPHVVMWRSTDRERAT